MPSPVTGKPYTWTTYPERLTQAGISWRVYQEEDDYGTNLLEWFAAYQDATPGSAAVRERADDLPAGPVRVGRQARPAPDRLVDPPDLGPERASRLPPASGANFLASKLNAVAENRDLWSKTVFIVNYDENDGLFDHVAPPLPPAGTAGRVRPGRGSPNWPIGGGIRVPASSISPWSVGGFVATEQFDHTSVLQFLERLTGVAETNITAWRRQTFGDLTSALGFSNGKATTFPRTLPNTIGEFWEAEQEVADAAGADVPATNQTPPVQEKRRPRLPWTPQPRQGTSSGSARRCPAPRAATRRTARPTPPTSRLATATRSTWRRSRRSRATRSPPSTTRAPTFPGSSAATWRSSTPRRSS